MTTVKFVLAAICVAGLVVLRKRKLRRLHARIIYHRDKDMGYRFGMDVGGTLGKLVYFEKKDGSASDLGDVNSYLVDTEYYGKAVQRDNAMMLDVPGGRIHFLRFETSQVEYIVEFVLHRCFHRDIRTIACTGGGAFKFSKLFEDHLGISLHKCDELECLIRGMVYVMRHVHDECFTFKVLLSQGIGEATKKITKIPQSVLNLSFALRSPSEIILKVTSETEYHRVSGTSLGGGTFLGLCKLLSKYKSFDEALEASVEGNSQTVDMNVGDIYGGNYTQFNLSASTLASSFGKMGTKYEPKSGVRDEDVARSLLIMITTNIGQVAYLSALRSNTQRIYFCGNFLRQNEIASRQLAYAIDYWSKSKMEAQFFHHEGFFGALGALLTNNKELNIEL
ncbi:unnamed protein product [Aphanomyces euteiches]